MKIEEKLSKTHVFLVCTLTLVKGFITLKLLKTLFDSLKNSRPAFWCKLKKKRVFAKFLLFQLLALQNAENDCFDQRLECAVPKRWLKYTTQRQC